MLHICKGYPSDDIHAVCNANYRFLSIYAFWPGYTHDSFVLQQCSLFRSLMITKSKGCCSMILATATRKRGSWRQSETHSLESSARITTRRSMDALRIEHYLRSCEAKVYVIKCSKIIIEKIQRCRYYWTQIRGCNFISLLECLSTPMLSGTP